MTKPVSPAIVVLTQRGLETAERIRRVFPESGVYGRQTRVSGADETYPDTPDMLATLFGEGRSLIVLGAAGIVIRSLAPHLVEKRQEPPVIAVAEDGSAVVPLLGGHHGANELSRRIAQELGVSPAITTAGDISFGVALDEPPPGYRLANPEHAKTFMARLLAGEPVRLQGEAPWLSESALPFSSSASLTLMVTTEKTPGSETKLIYHPACLALGVGCERGVGLEEIESLVSRAVDEAGLAPESFAGVFSLDLKCDEPAILALAEHLGLPARFFTAERLEAERDRLANPSDLVFQEVGCHGVSEGAALAAAGPEGTLSVPKMKSRRATVAVAAAPGPLDPAALGRGRGTLVVAGLGPGDPAWQTPEFRYAVAAASDLVGYSLYIDLLGTLADGKVRHDYALGEEEDRVRHALDLAAEGRDVALVCSGDPGIYAMAALAFELLERDERPEWRRVALGVVPGLSALQAAAARIGAPLGHDFCAISLSDLLTPWETIERRVKAAADGDFVVAFYNPVSRRRREQFVRATEILRERRPRTTPVVIARNLGREGESVRVMNLDAVAPDDIDMQSIVLVGSSETRRVARDDGGCWVYTPRGYESKAIGSRDRVA